jgi:hypothetical protein
VSGHFLAAIHQTEIDFPAIVMGVTGLEELVTLFVPMLFHT